MRQKSIYDRASAEKYVHFYRLFKFSISFVNSFFFYLRHCTKLHRNVRKQYNQQNISRMWEWGQRLSLDINMALFLITIVFTFWNIISSRSITVHTFLSIYVFFILFSMLYSFFSYFSFIDFLCRLIINSLFNHHDTTNIFPFNKFTFLLFPLNNFLSLLFVAFYVWALLIFSQMVLWFLYFYVAH